MSGLVEKEPITTLVHAALTWAYWSAGEGICAVDDTVTDPEDFLMDYSSITGEEDWVTIPTQISAYIEELEAANAKLTARLAEVEKALRLAGKLNRSLYDELEKARAAISSKEGA